MRRFTLFMASLILTMGVALAQRTVRGVVISADDNQPVVSASVRVKGTTLGMSTDLEGRFLFRNVPANAKTLVVSFVGFKTQEVPIKPEMRIVLLTDTSELGELVISGYGSAKAIANTTASIVKVSSKTIQDKPVPNVFDALQGKVAGLQILTSSGEPGAISSIQIHGRGTLSDLSSEPLYVLDGIPVEAGTILGLNQNDFESIQVLKDASATSIYGSRAANGVIYLTSKRGRTGERATITVRGKYGVSSLANTDYYENLMHTDELLEYYLETKRVGQAYVDKIRQTYPNDFRWYKYFYRDDAPSYDADLSISGGGGRTSYYFSASMLKSDGLRPRSAYERYGLRLNLNSSLNDYISFGLKNALSYDETQSTFNNGLYTSGGLGFSNMPWYSPFDKDGNRYVGENIPGLRFTDINYMADMFPSKSSAFNITSIANIILKPFKGMTISSTAGMNLTDSFSASGRRPLYYTALGNGSRNLGFSRSVGWTFTNTAEYDFTLARDHHFTLLAAHEYLEYTGFSMGASGSGIEEDRLYLLNQATKEKSVSESFSQDASLSFFGRLSYDFQKRYFIDATLRNDASSKFHPDVRNGLFWSAGLMWKMKEESFLKDINWIDRASVKLSHGTSGNSGVSPYIYMATVGGRGQYMGAPGWGITGPGNEKLTWENQAKTTLAFDLSFFDRLAVGLDLYNRVTTDMLMNVPQPGTTGFGSIMKNVAKYQNRGVDLQLRADLLKSKDGLNLSAFLNFNYNTDKILELFDGLDSWERSGTGLTYVVGNSLSFYTPIFKGINPENGHSEWYVPGEDRNVTTKDDSKVVDSFDESRLIQNTGRLRTPPINGGFGLNLSYKGFYASVDFSFTLGKYMFNNDGFFTENGFKFATVLNANRRIRNFWKQKGDVVDYPSVDYMRAHDGVAVEFDTRLLENASFMRMKNATIGYQVPRSILAKQRFFKDAKVYVTGRNLLTFTKYTGQDPEPDTNVSAGRNPNTKQVTVGLEVSF